MVHRVSRLYRRYRWVIVLVMLAFRFAVGLTARGEWNPGDAPDRLAITAEPMMAHLLAITFIAALLYEVWRWEKRRSARTRNAPCR